MGNKDLNWVANFNGGDWPECGRLFRDGLTAKECV